MKTKLAVLLAALLAAGGSLFAQLSPAPSSTGNITTNAANCNTTNVCVVLHMATSNVGFSVTVSGTWTGTLTVEQSGDNQATWSTATTTTANTLYTSALLPGITDARVRSSAAMTGTAVVTITASGPATIQNNIGGSGSGSPSSLTTFFNKYYGKAPQDYGAFGDWHVYQAAITNTSTTLTCATCTFTAADTGKTYEVITSALNAKPVVTQTGTITFLTATTVQLSVAANNTQAATRFGYGHNDNTAMQNWMAAICAASIAGVPNLVHGGYVPQGGYYVTAPLVCTNTQSSGTVNNGAGASSTNGECGPNGGTNGANLRCSLWLTGDGFTSSFIEFATAGSFTWPTTSGTAQSGNACAMNIQNWDGLTVNGIGFLFDGSPQNTTSVTGKVANLCLQNSSHANVYEMWVQDFHNTTNNAIGLLSYNDFESKYEHNATEGNDLDLVIDGDTGNTLEKLDFMDDFLENPGFYATATNIGQNLFIGDPGDGRALNVSQLRFRNIHSTGAQLADVNINNITTLNNDAIMFSEYRQNGGNATNLGFVLNGSATVRVECYACIFSSPLSLHQIDSVDVNAKMYLFGGEALAGTSDVIANNGNTMYIYGTSLNSGTTTGTGNIFSFIPVATGWLGKGTDQSTAFYANQGTACTNGELALSAGWQSTGSATVTAVSGTGQTCSWTITTGTTTAANPTVTDTLTNPAPAATTACEMNIHGGTHTAAAGEGFTQTTLSATAPIFTFIGTPTAGGTTYFVTRRCGP